MSLLFEDVGEVENLVADTVISREDQGEHSAGESNAYWLTIRRRCELCKQRKVRGSRCFCHGYCNRSSTLQLSILRTVAALPPNFSYTSASAEDIEHLESLHLHRNQKPSILSCFQHSTVWSCHTDQSILRSNVIAASQPVDGAPETTPFASTRRGRNLV